MLAEVSKSQRGANSVTVDNSFVLTRHEVRLYQRTSWHCHYTVFVGVIRVTRCEVTFYGSMGVAMGTGDARLVAGGARVRVPLFPP